MLRCQRSHDRLAHGCQTGTACSVHTINRLIKHDWYEDIMSNLKQLKETLDSSTAMTTSFSNIERVRLREQVSFWRENEIAVVILQQGALTTTATTATRTSKKAIGLKIKTKTFAVHYTSTLNFLMGRFMKEVNLTHDDEFSL